MDWPLAGGYLERLGLPPQVIRERSRRRAVELVSPHFRGMEALLVAEIIYATGDPGLVHLVRLGGDPVGKAVAALEAGRSVVVDVAMVSAGVRLPSGQTMAVAVQAAGAECLALHSGTTRAAAGMKELWPRFGAGGLIVVGNAPTALLAVLDLAEAVAAPACVIATCPGFTSATEAKDALATSKLPHLVIAGSRGGTGAAVAALNFLLAAAGKNGAAA